MTMKKSLLFLWLLTGCQLAENIEPISMSALIGGALFASTYYMFEDKIACQFSECCSSPHWVPHNVTKFEELFNQHVFGQHIVRDIVSKSLRAHLSKGTPKKALVLSFHGWTGTGKNFVANFVAKSLFRKGVQSRFVQQFISTVDFPDDAKVDIYKLDVQKKIFETVKGCNQSLFIFDEIDKMPEGLVDGIKPFIDYHEHIHGLDFRRTVFIFLSNTGGKAINDIAFQAWAEGRHRNDIKYSELENLVKNGAFNEIGGLHHSSVIDKHLVDRFVPFLPLERTHIKQCVLADMKSRNLTFELTKDQMDSVLDEIDYYPKSHQVYSTTGCKTVSAKVDLLLEDL